MLFFFVSLLLALCGNAASSDDIISSKLSQMSLKDKVGQMTQLNIDMLTKSFSSLTLDEAKLENLSNVGSFLNTPFAMGPVEGKSGWNATEWRDVLSTIHNASSAHMLYGIDSVHGANYVKGAVMFGQQINAASSFNPSLVTKMGQITAKDTLAGGMQWIFAPILGIAVSSTWPRVYETFGEDPFVASTLGKSLIAGLEKFDDRVAACMKHFIAYSNPSHGLDRENVQVSDFDLLNYYAPAFDAAIKAGVKTAMEGYNSVNGVPVVASTKLLQTLLRDILNFDGVLVSDWAEVNNLVSHHHVAATEKAAAKMSLSKTSLDISMVPQSLNFQQNLLELVESGEIPVSRLDESVRRILKLKSSLGLLSSKDDLPGEEYVDTVGSQEDQNVALDLATESLVLVKNANNVLPLNPKESSVLLTGPLADNVGLLCGGWSVAWQGTSTFSQQRDIMFPHGKSIKDALSSSFSNLKFSPGMSGTSVAASAEYTIIAIGEDETYAEKPGDDTDLRLSPEQVTYVNDIATTAPNTKIIVVLVTGRPRLLANIPKVASAVLVAFLPCEAGGKAIASVLSGKVNPSGRLPISWPSTNAAIKDLPYYHLQSTLCGESKCKMEWDFGTGLSYTSFRYSNMQVTATDASITVTNVGSRSGKETVMLFVSQDTREVHVPEVKMLKGFEKISLRPKESKVVKFNLADAFGYYDPKSVFDTKSYEKTIDGGNYKVMFKPDTDPNECNTSKFCQSISI